MGRSARQPAPLRIELLYFDGCPSYQSLLPRLRELVAEADRGAELELRCLSSIEDAERQRFLGSPTVRVDGEDVEPEAATREDFGIKCRLYRSDSGISGLPPEEWIRAALGAKDQRDPLVRRGDE